MGIIINLLWNIGKLLLVLWTIVIAATLKREEIGNTVEGLLKSSFARGEQNKRIISGAVILVLFVPAYLVRNFCHLVYRFILKFKATAKAVAPRESQKNTSKVKNDDPAAATAQ